MLKVGSVIVPTSAFVFLSIVIALLIFLLVLLTVLNKLLCFANIQPSSYLCPETFENIHSDSESDDSDEEIFNNYANIERTAVEDKLRCSISSRSGKLRSSTRSTGSKSGLGDEVHFAPAKHTTDIPCPDDDHSIQESSFERAGSFCKKLDIVAVAKIHLLLDTENSKLKIQIIQVVDILGSDKKQEPRRISLLGSSNRVTTYQVHLSVLPAKKHRFKTKTKPGNDPAFNETFYVPKVTKENADSLAIRIRLYGNQDSSSNIIGQCTFDLSTVDLSTDTEYNLTMIKPDDDDSMSRDVISVPSSERPSIQTETVEGQEDYPELLLGLAHNANTGRLTVEIVQGSCLSKDKNKNFYVKLSLFSASGQELSHTKTSIRKNTTSPVFRESFMFQVALFQMKEVTLMVSVFAKKSIHRKELIGWLALGCKSSGEEEQNHWLEIMEGEKTEVIHSYRVHQNNNSKKLLK